MCSDLVEGGGDGLDLLVVRRDAGADEAVGGRHAVEEVDLYDHARLPQEVIGRVEPGGAGADDRDSQRPLTRSGCAHEAIVASRGRRRAGVACWEVRALTAADGEAYTPSRGSDPERRSAA